MAEKQPTLYLCVVTLYRDHLDQAASAFPPSLPYFFSLHILNAWDYISQKH